MLSWIVLADGVTGTGRVSSAGPVLTPPPNGSSYWALTTKNRNVSLPVTPLTTGASRSNPVMVIGPNRSTGSGSTLVIKGEQMSFDELLTSSPFTISTRFPDRFALMSAGR